MVSPICPVLLLCWFMTQRLLILSQCVEMSLNRFRKYGKCMTPKHKWYMKLYFCIWLLTIHTIITWPRFTSVINFVMCNEFPTKCVSTSGGGLFYFGATILSLSICTLFTKHPVKRARWIPWVIMSFGVWFAWRRLTPQILAAVIIWFQRFNSEE